MKRDTLIFPMNPNPTHEFGRLSGYPDAYWVYADKMRKDRHDPFVYLSHSNCRGDPTRCSDGYVWNQGGLRWHFEIVREGTFVNKKLDYVMKTKWAKYVPPFRKYKDDTYWFLLKNLRKIKEESVIEGNTAKGGRVLDADKFWREIKGYERKIHSSIFRSSSGAPWVVKCAVEPPSQSDTEEMIDPIRTLAVNTITKRGGISEQTIEEIFLLKILREGFDGKEVEAIWEQEGFTDAKEAKLYRFDLAFRLVDGTHFAIELKKGFGKDAPLQLKNYILKSPLLRDKNPIPVIVCAIKTEKLVKQMEVAFPQTRWRIVEFRPKIVFEDVTPYGKAHERI